VNNQETADMKKTYIALSIAGALFVNSNVLAFGNKNNPTVSPAKNTQVSFDNVTLDSKLTIKDSRGQILYSEQIESTGRYTKGFDLSALPSNDYYFEVDKDAFISIYPFTVLDDFVELHDDQVSSIVKPMLVLDEHRVKLMRNLDEAQSIEVDIYFQGRNLVFSEKIHEDGMVGRTYDFSTSAGGEYLFLIRYDDRSYSEYLSINTGY
jgi:hypothetical protein